MIFQLLMRVQIKLIVRSHMLIHNLIVREILMKIQKKIAIVIKIVAMKM